MATNVRTNVRCRFMDKTAASYVLLNALMGNVITSQENAQVAIQV